MPQEFGQQINEKLLYKREKSDKKDDDPQTPIDDKTI